MGHFVPLVRLAECFEKRGHQVTFLTLRYEQERAETMLKRSQLAAKIVYVDSENDQYTEKEVHGSLQGKSLPLKEGILKGDDIPGTRVLIPTIKERLTNIGPDMVVSDIISYVFINAADELGLPTVVHAPLPVKQLAFMTFTMIPMKENSCACCGIICIQPSFMTFLIKDILPVFGMIDKGYEEAWIKCQTRLVISNSFVGFDPPLHTPANWVFYGPAMAPDLSDAAARL